VRKLKNQLVGRVMTFDSDDIYFNLALEDAILRHSYFEQFMTLMFWRSSDAVVVGRGQLIEDEVDLVYCNENGVKIARRISGGGTVFTDMGNFNICVVSPIFITGFGNDVSKTCRLFTKLLMKSLNKLRIPDIDCDVNNSLFYNGKKFSGSAAYFSSKTLLHHATLLVSTNLTNLEKSLIHRSGATRRRSSKYVSTTNLDGLNVDKWKSTLIDSFKERFNIILKPDKPSISELSLAKELRNSMYSTQKWILNRERS